MPKRILIAEDELEAKELLTSIANKFGYQVISVADGVDLLTAAEKERFDVIITDLKMPNLNGASAAKIMKMQGNTTPVIALTALNSNDIDLFSDVFTKIFYKPYDVKELFKYIGSLID